MPRHVADPEFLAVEARVTDLETAGGGGGGNVYVNHGTVGATADLDLSVGNVHDLTLAEDVTLTLSGEPVGAVFLTVILRGAFNVTWPVEVEWPDGVPPVPDGLTTVSLLTVDGGVSWQGFMPAVPSGGTAGPVGVVLAHQEYEAGADAALATNATAAFTDVSAANASVAFVFPPSGEVIVEVSALCGHSAAAYCRLNLRTDAGADIAGTDMHVHYQGYSRVLYRKRVTGTPGASQTLRLGIASSAALAQAALWTGPSYGPLVITVFDPEPVVAASGVELGRTLWNPNAGVNAGNVATPTTIHPDLHVAFTVPVSGNVDVTFEGVIELPAATNLILSLHDGTSVVGQAYVAMTAASDQTPIDRKNVTFVLTGLTPGANLDLELRHHRTTGTGTVIFYGGTLPGGVPIGPGILKAIAA